MGSQRFGHDLATEKQQQQGKEFKQIKPSNDKKVVCIMNIARYDNIYQHYKKNSPSVPNDES